MCGERIRYPSTFEPYKRAKMALYHSPNYQTCLESVSLSVQEKFNIDFQDGSPWISNQNNYSYFFIYKSSRYFQ